MSATVLVIIFSALLLIAYDVYIIMKEGKFESISAYIIRGSKKYPLLVLAFGMLLGHLFFSMNTFDYEKREIIIKKCNDYIKVNNVKN